MDEKDNQIREIFDISPERLSIAADGISVAIQQEYLELTKRINFKKYSQEDISAATLKLFRSALPLEKKKVLTVLAQQGTLEAYKAIKKFVDSGERELKDWGVLAQQECRILLEGSLSDQKVGIVMTGLGGENNKLRYYAAVHSRCAAALSDIQKKTVTRSFLYTCRKFDSNLEEVQSYYNYVTMKVLIPLDVAVADIVEGGIKECNAFGDFLDDCYYVTNVKIPTESEIQHYFKEMRKDEE